MATRKDFLYLSAKLFTGFIIKRNVNESFFYVSKGQLEKLSNKLGNSDSPINLFDSIKDFRLIIDHDPNNISIISYKESISRNLTFPENANLSCFTFTFDIKDNLKLNGKNLYLFAKKINSENGTFDTSGNNGDDFSEPQIIPNDCSKNREGGKDPGVDGDNVNTQGIREDIKDVDHNGPMNGIKGGDICLNIMQLNEKVTILARGGKGGKGEFGAVGMPGCPFICAPGADFRQGGSGFPGRDGGNGALGGYGGDGGKVEIYLAANNSDIKQHLIVDNAFGFGGQFGRGGMPGKGGDPSPDPCRLSPSYSIGSVRGHPWVRGKNGKPGLADAEGSAARKGKSIQPTITVSVDQYFKYVPSAFGNILLLKAESLYLNQNESNLKEAIEIFEFIIMLAENGAGTGYINANQTFINNYLYYFKEYNEVEGIWNNLASKSLSYLNQINMGADFFGNPSNYAPNLEPDYLLSRYNRIIGFIDGFEDFAINLINAHHNIQITQEQNQLCINQLDTNIFQLREEIRKCSDQIIQLSDELRLRFSRIEELKGILHNDDTQFRNAITTRADGCELGTVLIFLTSVVAIGATLGGSIAAIGGIAGGVGRIVSGLQASETFDLLRTALGSEGIINQGVNDISKNMADIQGNISRFRAVYNKISFNNSQTPNTLIGVDKKKFDETINQFLNLPEARQYKNDFHHFLDYVQLTNEKRILFTTYVLTLNTLRQNIKVYTAQRNQLQRVNIQMQRGKLSLAQKDSIVNLYYHTKASLTKLIYMQNRAIAYQDPSQQYDRQIADYDIHTLKNTLFQQNFALIDSLNRRSYYRTFNRRPLVISKDKFKNAFELFSHSYRDDIGTRVFQLDFKIALCSLDETNNEECISQVNYLNGIFSNIKNIKVMGVLATLKGRVTTDKQINFTLRHLGDSAVNTLNNFQGIKMFSHLWKEAHLHSNLSSSEKIIVFSEEQKINLVGTAFGNGDTCFLGVSPFASWRLKIKENENPDINITELQSLISSLTSINLNFWYYYENIS